jgi:hypothetical protein
MIGARCGVGRREARAQNIAVSLVCLILKCFDPSRLNRGGDVGRISIICWSHYLIDNWTPDNATVVTS